MVVIFTLACGITLSVWALNQLNKLPIQAFPAGIGAKDQRQCDYRCAIADARRASRRGGGRGADFAVEPAVLAAVAV